MKKKKKQKSKHDENEEEWKQGSFKYGMRMKQNPLEFYHSRLEYLKEQRKNKRNNKKSLLKWFKNKLNKQEK